MMNLFPKRIRIIWLLGSVVHIDSKQNDDVCNDNLGKRKKADDEGRQK